jgi:hypothetical protein
MAIVYGEIEPLEKIINLLRHIDEAKHLSTLDDVLAFKKTCDQKVYEVESRVRREQGLIIDEQKSIISALEHDYSAKLSEKRRGLALKSQNFADRLNNPQVNEVEGAARIGRFFKKIAVALRLGLIRLVGEKYVIWSLRKPARKIKKEKQKLKNQESSFELIVEGKVRKDAKPFYEAKRIIEFNNSHLIGAIGEQRVLDELRKLPDSFTVINNFQLCFDKALFYRKNNEWINSVQADHIVIGPSGVFLIETKNWSQRSVDELVDFTPVNQLKRTNFALFCYLNRKKKKGVISLIFGKTDNKKVTIRSILVMVNAMTDEKDQFVKVLNVDRLVGYLTYFSTTIEEEEKEAIVKKLLF